MPCNSPHHRPPLSSIFIKRGCRAKLSKKEADGEVPSSSSPAPPPTMLFSIINVYIINNVTYFLFSWDTFILFYFVPTFIFYRYFYSYSADRWNENMIKREWGTAQKHMPFRQHVYWKVYIKVSSETLWFFAGRISNYLRLIFLKTLKIKEVFGFISFLLGSLWKFY